MPKAKHKKNKVKAESPVEAQNVQAEQEVQSQEPKSVPMVDHVVTQEDLDNNPELVGQINVGDVIQIPVDESQEEEPLDPAQEEEDEDDEPSPDVQAESPVEAPKSLDRPSWADPRLWNSLSPERQQKLVNGEDFRQ